MREREEQGQVEASSSNKSYEDDTTLKQPDSTPVKGIQEAVAPVNERSPRAGVPIDTDYNALPDLCPPTNMLNGDAYAIFTVDTPFSYPMDLHNDPDRDKLHPAELFLAARLRLTCASYLCSKRRIFQGLVEKLADGKEYRKIYAQQACKVDARKARLLYSAFEQVGWFERKHFAKHLPDCQDSSLEDSSDTDSLSSVDEQALISDGLGPSTSMASQNGLIRPKTHIAEPAVTTDTATTSSRKQKAPTRIMKRSPLKPARIISPVGLPTPIAPSFMPVNAVVAATTARAPPPAIIAPPNPEIQQFRKSGGGDAKGLKKNRASNGEGAASLSSLSLPSSSSPPHGQRETMIVCPYPRSWPEADSVDRELVRLKRREGRQWPELFEWWRSMGRMSLKNASCLAVRYSILKRKYEDIWEAEEREEGVKVTKVRVKKE